MGTRMGQPGGRKNDKKVMDRIMPGRFRPIAPKAVPPGSDAAAEMLASYVRTKRRYVKRSKPIEKNNSIVKEGGSKSDVMLEFADDALPSPASGGGGGGGFREVGSSTMWICAPVQPPPPPPILIYSNKTADYPTVVRNRNPPRRVVESWMTVHSMEEIVPGHGMNIGKLSGNTDKEKIMNLQNDTCPVLVSDSEQNVKYTNFAYKKMVDAGVEAEEAEEEEEGRGRRPLVSIKLEDKVPESWTVFTCIGRVEYILGNKKHTQSMPCDVWRMDFGGFLWRLDPEAALKLGR